MQESACARDLDDEPLVLAAARAAAAPASPARARYAPERRRFYVLLVNGALALVQCLNWFTFSSVDVASLRGYYGPHVVRGRLVVDALLAWGSLMGALLGWLPARLLAHPDGTRRATRLAAGLIAGGALLRLVPSLWVADPYNDDTELGGVPAGARASVALALLNLAQILNASAGVLVMAPASRLAVLWFGENERVLATAVCSTASGLGITVGFSRFGAAPRGRG